MFLSLKTKFVSLYILSLFFVLPLFATPKKVALKGIILNQDNQPVDEALVSVGAKSVTTGKDGSFYIENLDYQNQLLTVDRQGYYSEFFPLTVYGEKFASEVEILELKDINLTQKNDNSLRLFFAGDVHFGRRFLAPKADENYPKDIIPPSTPEALIKTSSSYEDSLSIFSYIGFVLGDQYSDYQSLNLESVVTNEPTTPHQVKDYVYFTLPESIKALKDIGVDYVSLGNNHLYDYLEKGVSDTIFYLNQVGLAHSGASNTLDLANQSYNFKFKNRDIAFFSKNSVSGERYPEPFWYNATNFKGGAAPLTDLEGISQEIKQNEDKGFLPVPMFHTGIEYSYAPSPASIKRFFSTLQDRGVIIGHHPHTAQGFGFARGVPIVYSLGNFIFDSRRHETLLGLAVLVDFDQENKVNGLQAIPVYIEDYIPKLATGKLADRLLKRLAEFSSDNRETEIIINNHRGYLALNREYKKSSRIVSKAVKIDSDGFGILDLRREIKGEEFLGEVEVVEGAPEAVRLGRDLLLYGEFEDYDIDSDSVEATEWDLRSRSLKLCKNAAKNGEFGVCSSRSPLRKLKSVLNFRKRIRLFGNAENIPQRDLSFLMSVKAQNTGRITAKLEFRASEKDREFGFTETLKLNGGTFPWRRYSKDVNFIDDPLNVLNPKTDAPRSLFLRIIHEPPTQTKESSLGVAYYDNVALISWGNNLRLKRKNRLKRTNALEFIKVSGKPRTETVIRLKISKLSLKS
jgi:poly-gamma-glutamate capsule biosynthesis protein CapA/YwtB (metallophosphatase superfamily)